MWTVRHFIVLLLVLLLPACAAARIEKLPVSPEDAAQARRLSLEGDRLLRQGKDHLALVSYVEASTLDPYNEVIFNKLAIGYSRLLMFDQAKRAIKRSIRLNPDYAFGYNTEGIIALAVQRPSDAVKGFRKAIELRPDKAAFHINLGNAYLRLGKYQEGKAAFLKAVELDPNAFKTRGTVQIATVSETPDVEYYFQMARLNAELEDSESAVYYLEKALSAGFKEFQRITEDPIFEGLKENFEFIQLMNDYGIQSRPGA